MNTLFGRERPLVMGVLNITPDSFSDGGKWLDSDAAIAHAVEMVEQGADIIDLGAESTRPGSEPVSSEEEWERLSRVLKELVGSLGVTISVDTVKADVADKALKIGADIVNDVNGLRGDRMMQVCADHDAAVIIGHMDGEYGNMHGSYMGPSYRNEIRDFLDTQCARAVDSGISDEKILIDPGLGFGKTPDQNMDIIRDCSFLGDAHPIVIGASRKRFVRHFYPDSDPDDATAILSRIAVESGASVVRVHNVARTVSELRL